MLRYKNIDVMLAKGMPKSLEIKGLIGMNGRLKR